MTATQSVATETPPLTDLAEPVRSHAVDPRERAAQIREGRKGQVGNLQQKLPYFGEKEGWKRRWVLGSNVPGRQQEGYTFVDRAEVVMKAAGIGFGNQDVGNKVAVHAGKGLVGLDGAPELLYLMEIPQEIAKELDYEKSGKAIRASVTALKSGNTGGHISADQNAYVPKDFSRIGGTS